MKSQPTTDPRLETVSCALCGSDDVDIRYPSQRADNVQITPDEFRSSGDEALRDPLVRCRQCRLEYVTPRLKASVVLEGYANAVDETFVSQAVAREQTFGRCLRLVEKAWGKPPGRLLDIGTANGSFLQVAKTAGWDVTGCEPNKWMTQWCQKNYGIEVIAGTVFDGRFPAASFDVITLWDVLEHTPDPLAVLRECYRLMKPGGLLVVNYPDIGAWIARAMGRKWVFLLSVHYYYFTTTTIRDALNRTGWEPFKLKPHFQSLELDYILFRATPYAAFLAKPLRQFVNALGLGKVSMPYWVGQTLVLSRKKAKAS